MRVPDGKPWKLEATLPDQVVAGVHRGRVAKLASELKAAADLRVRGEASLVVEHRGPVIVVLAMRHEQLETVRRELDVVLAEAKLSAEVTVAHRRVGGEIWETTAGPYHAPRARHGGHRRQRPRPLLSPAAKRRWLIATLVAAIAGVIYYALAPGVASTQVGLPLTVPLLCIALVWLHRHLPLAVQWAIAVPLAVAGPASYVIFSGAQLWAWGQLAVFPLFGLLIDRGFIKRGTPPRSGPWYGGPMQGPYGPP
jgi:hypothetical protein